MSPPDLLIGVCSIGVALLIHEFAHAWMAYQLGDPTAKYEGRLTLNPVVHFEVMGAIALIASFVTSGGSMIMGWAKPVPITIENFKNRSLDLGLVALAGPFVNFFVAFVCSMFVLTGLVVSTPFYVIFKFLIVANVGFGLFNLIPCPPLDGWKMVGAVLPEAVSCKMRDLEAKAGLWSLVVLFLILALAGNTILYPINQSIIRFFLGGQV